VGPVLGALLAAGFYKISKWLEYETVNPGQDDEGPLPDDEASRYRAGDIEAEGADGRRSAN
jgi:hypothetical protein